MERRTFLRLFAGLLPLGLVRPGHARGTGILVQQSPLAGFQYYRGEALWPRLAPGQRLELRREPDNPHDPRAVRVLWRGQALGYLPRRENTAVSQMLDRGQRLETRIAALRESADPWQRLRLEIRLCT